MSSEIDIQKHIHNLGNDHRQVRQAAAQSLGQLGEGMFAKAVLAALDGKPQALIKLKDSRPLIRALGDGKWQVPNTAIRAVEPLIRALDDIHVRKAAAKALGQLGDRRAVEPLIHTLGDNEWRVRQSAAHALMQLGEGIFAKAVLAALDGKPQALVKLKDPRAIEPLIRALEYKDVRQAVAQTLGWLGDHRAVEPLIRAKGDQRESVRHAALDAIRAICENNQRRLGSGCVCAEHLNRFTFQQVSLSSFEKNGYYVCRTCQAIQPRYDAVSNVVLVLDDRTKDLSPIQQEHILYAPWNLTRGIFDFNTVELRAGASSNIERFLVQLEEDADPARPWKQEIAGKPPCRVLPGCTLSLADRARLQRHLEIVDEAP